MAAVNTLFEVTTWPYPLLMNINCELFIVILINVLRADDSRNLLL